jgi:hypothetical protein
MNTNVPPVSTQSVRFAVACLLAGLLCSGAALAAPTIFLLDADLAEKEVIAGENITVDATLKNSGDGGFITISLSPNESGDSTSKRVRVNGDSKRVVALNTTIDTPGKYTLVVNDGTRKERTGTLTVSDIKVTNTTTRADGRNVTVRGGTAKGSLTAALPTAPNQTIAVESVTVGAPGSAFNRTVSTYGPPENASFEVPDDGGATILGAIELSGTDGVTTTGLQVTVTNSSLANESVPTDAVQLYQANGIGYEAVDTVRNQSRDGVVVLNATTTSSDQYLVGTLSPRFTVTNTAINTGSTDGGKRINLTATVRNDGPIAGSYKAPLRVNGDTVSTETVTVQPGESTTVIVTHTVTSDGDYDISLGNQSVGSVVLTTGASDSPATGQGDGDEAAPIGEVPGVGPVSMTQVAVGAGIILLGGALVLFRRR